MKWLLLIAFVALAKSEDYDCPAGKSSKTITIGEGDSFEFNSNPNGAEDYKNKQKCTVKYKRAKSCNEMKFECQSFNVQNNAQNCKKGDKLFIGNKAFCQTQAVSETTEKKVLKVRFISNKKKTESGAQCTVSCIDPEPPVTTEAPSTTEGKYSKEYFRKTGELRHITKLKPWPLYDVLTEKYEWDTQIAREFADWLLPMLAYDPNERATALDCINHPFMADV